MDIIRLPFLLVLQYRVHENDCFLLAVAGSDALLVSGGC